MARYYFLICVLLSTDVFSSTAFFTNKHKTNSSTSQRVYSDSVYRQIIPPPNPGQRIYSNSGSTVPVARQEVQYFTAPVVAVPKTSTSLGAQTSAIGTTPNSQQPSAFVAGPCEKAGSSNDCGPVALTYSWEIKFCTMHGCTRYSAQNIFDIDRTCSASNAGQVIRFIQAVPNEVTQDHVAVCLASTATDFLTQIAQQPSETVYLGPKKEYYWAVPPITQAEHDLYGIIVTSGHGRSCTSQNLGEILFVPKGVGNTLDRTYKCVLKGSAEDIQIISGTTSAQTVTPVNENVNQCTTGEFLNDFGQTILWKCKCNGDTSGWTDIGNQCFHKVK